MNATKHIAGEMIDGVQNCILCGETIMNIQNTISFDGHALKGFPPGEVYFFNHSNNKTEISTIPPKLITINNCSK